MGAQNGTPQQSHPSDAPAQSASNPAPYPTTSRSPQSSDGRIDPSIGGGGGPSPPGQQHYMGPMVMDETMDGMDGGKGANRRELSSTKRAAQNRAAQVCSPLYRHEMYSRIHSEHSASAKRRTSQSSRSRSRTTVSWKRTSSSSNTRIIN